MRYRIESFKETSSSFSLNQNTIFWIKRLQCDLFVMGISSEPACMYKNCSLFHRLVEYNIPYQRFGLCYPTFINLKIDIKHGCLPALV